MADLRLVIRHLMVKAIVSFLSYLQKPTKRLPLKCISPEELVFVALAGIGMGCILVNRACPVSRTIFY